MVIIEINQLSNGAHRNQSGAKSVPEGWAVVPDSLATPNFPFGELEVEEVDGVMTVTSWEPLPIPEPEPETDDISSDEALDIIMGGADDDQE